MHSHPQANLKGSMVALVTPYNDNQLDLAAFTNIVNWQYDQGTAGIVVAGSTGEGMLLTHDEYQQLLKTAVDVNNKRMTVIAAAAGFTVESTRILCHIAETAGIDALMVVAPSYLKPTQQALYAYYQQLHDLTQLQLIIYNNPGRTGGTFVHDDTVCELAKLPRIVGVKDSTGCLIRPAMLRQRLGQEFILLSGDDLTTPAFLAQGGDGAISVSANVIPGLNAQLHKAWQNCDLQTFARIRDAMMPLLKALTLEANPITIKHGVAYMNLCSYKIRSPLTPLQSYHHKTLQTILDELTDNGHQNPSRVSYHG